MRNASFDRTCLGRSPSSLWLCLLAMGACLSASAQPGRIVEFGDENRDGRYTGRDVELALERCRPGCVLRAGAHTYEDVAVIIDKDFPQGLQIEGAGAEKTIFRSPVPVRAPIFWVRAGQRGVRVSQLRSRRSEIGANACQQNRRQRGYSSQ